MNGVNSVRMTYGNLLTTLVLVGGLGLWVTDIASSTDTNAQDIKHEKELAEQDRKHIKETLTRIENALRDLAKE